MSVDRSKRYRVKSWNCAVAVRVTGCGRNWDDEWEEWVDDENWARVVMVGDDAHHFVEADDLEELDELAYCAECGQIGCGHDGRER